MMSSSVQKNLIVGTFGIFLFVAAASIFRNPAQKTFPVLKEKQIPIRAAMSDAAAVPPRRSSGENVFVTRVIDGDTIEIEGRAHVRYIGINAPETVDPRRPVQCFGHEASAKNKELVEGKQVRLEKDVSGTDRYGRLLRYVYLGDDMINLLLVKEGYAQSATFPPDVKYHPQFIDASREAREKKLGLWASCPLRL